MATGGVVADQSVPVRPDSQRLAHLDRLKVLTAGVIAAHAAMSYGTAGTWLYEEDSLSQPLALTLSVLVGGARVVLPDVRNAHVRSHASAWSSTLPGFPALAS